MVFESVPVGFQTGSCGIGFDFDGGAFEPMNFGRLIEPPGRQIGPLAESERALTEDDRGRSKRNN